MCWSPPPTAKCMTPSNAAASTTGSAIPMPRANWQILRAKVRASLRKLSEQVVAFVQALRKEDLFKSPRVAETLDWPRAHRTRT